MIKRKSEVRPKNAIQHPINNTDVPSPHSSISQMLPLTALAALAALACCMPPVHADIGDAEASWSATLYPFGISSNGYWSEGTIAGYDNNLYPTTFAHGGETYKIDRLILTESRAAIPMQVLQAAKPTRLTASFSSPGGAYSHEWTAPSRGRKTQRRSSGARPRSLARTQPPTQDGTTPD